MTTEHTFIVERFAIEAGMQNTERAIEGAITASAKNIQQRLSEQPDKKAVANTFDYKHGETSEIEREGLNILVHSYKADGLIQYELSIELQ